jgi:hypothetical protein
MFSDKKFGLPKDLIDTVKKVVDENKNNNKNEKEEINEVAIKVLSKAGKWISGAPAQSTLEKSGKMAPRGIPPTPRDTAVIPSSGGAGKPPPPPTPPTTSGGVTPSSGSKGGAIDVNKARQTAVDIPTTPLKQKPDMPTSTQGSNYKKYIIPGAAAVGGAAIGAAIPKDSVTTDSNDPGGSYDRAPSPSKTPSTPKIQQSQPKPKSTIERTPDLDAPTGPAGMSKRQASEMGFSYEDGGKKKKAVKESALINAFLALHEKRINRAPSTLSAAAKPQTSNPRGETVGGDYNVYSKRSQSADEFRDIYDAAKKSGAGSFNWQGRGYTVKGAPKGAGKYVKPADAAAERNEPGSGVQKALGGSTGTKPQVPVDPNVKDSMNQTPTGGPDSTAMPATVQARRERAYPNAFDKTDAEAQSSQSARTLGAARTVAPMAQKADRPVEKPSGQEGQLTLGQRAKASREMAAKGDITSPRPTTSDEISHESGGKKKKVSESLLVRAFLALEEKRHPKGKKLDPIGKEDEDVDNDGKVDSTDKYLKHRRDVIGKNIKEEEITEESDRISYHKKMIKRLQKELANDPRNSRLKEKLAYHKKLLSELSEEIEIFLYEKEKNVIKSPSSELRGMGSLSPNPPSKFYGLPKGGSPFSGSNDEFSLPKTTPVKTKKDINNDSDLDESEKWIQKAIKKPGALHKQLGVPEGEKIPSGELKSAAKKGGKLGQRARLAMTLKKLHKEEIQLSDDEVAHLEAVSDKDEQKITNKEGSSRKGPTVPNRDLTD